MSRRPATPPARLRTSYLDQVLRTLYPGGPPAGCPGPAPPPEYAEFLVLPPGRRPRLLVPAGAPRAAAAAVRYATEPGSRRSRLARSALAAGLRSGVAERLLPHRVRVDTAGSVEPHLRELLGRPATLAIHIGPVRANRKPVLQLLSPTGEAIGFAKLGTGPLTRRLVRAETAALAALAPLRLRELTVPEVLHSGSWRGHQLLVQSVVPVWRRRAALCRERLARAMREVAGCCGTRAGELATSPYWQRLQERVAAVSGQPEGAVLATAAASLARRAGGVELRYGAWHGDWSPWNMAALGDTLLVWDWERFGVGVPLGFDAVHYELHRRLRSTPDAAAAVAATLDAAGALLAPFDVPPAARQLTALLYLVDLAARYLADRQAEAGARLGVLGTWLLPVLTSRLQEVA